MKGRRIPKNIVHAVTARYMRQNKGRTLTTFLGIVFTVLLMTCVFVGRESSIAYLEEVASMKNGQWHYTLYDVTSQEQAELQALPYVSGTAASVSLGLTEFPASANPERPYLNVKAYEAQTLTWNNIRVTEGRMPSHSGELVLSESCRADGSAVQLGDRIDAAFFQRSITGIQDGQTIKTYFPFFSLEIASGETKDLPLSFPHYEETDSFRIDQLWTGRTGSYTVVGFIETPPFEPASAAGYTALTLADPALLAQEEQVNLLLRLDLRRAPSTVYLTLRDIAGEGSVESNDYLLAFSANSSDQTMNLMVNLMTGFFLLLILAVSVVLIYNVFNISFRERSRYLGMLSSIGATARQKRSSVYFEARTLLLAALPAGILAGFGVVLGGLHFIQPYVIQLVYTSQPQNVPSIHLVLSWQSLACVAAASVVTVLLSAFLPARKIGRIGPIASIQGSDEVKRVRARTGHPASAEGMTARGYLLRQGRSQRSLLLAVTAFLLVLVVASFGVSRVISIIDYKTGSPPSLETELQPRECVLYYNRNTENGPALYEALKQDLQARPEVASVTSWYSGIFVLDVDSSFYSEEYWNAYLDIAEEFLGQELSREELRERYITGRSRAINLLVPDDETLRQIAGACGADQSLLFGGKGAILINEITLDTDHIGFEMRKAQRYRFFDIETPTPFQPGDSFPVSLYNGDRDETYTDQLTVAGYANNQQLSPYCSISGEDLWLLVSRQTAEQLAQLLGKPLPDFLPEELHIQLAEGQEAFVDYLHQLIDGQDTVMVLSAWNDPDYMTTIADSICAILRILLAAFAALASVVCLLNLWNAIHGRMLERRRDFAVLRSVGATRRQLERMLLLECLGILGQGLLLSALLSGGLIALIHRGLSDLFGHLAFRLPWGLLAFALLFTAGAVLLITLYSFRQEKPQNLIECIRKDSV